MLFGIEVPLLYIFLITERTNSSYEYYPNGLFTLFLALMQELAPNLYY